MTTLATTFCSCADTPKARISVPRRAAMIAAALALVALITWGETWAIEHAPALFEQCSPALSSELARVLGDDCAYSPAPVSIAR